MENAKINIVVLGDVIAECRVATQYSESASARANILYVQHIDEWLPDHGNTFADVALFSTPIGRDKELDLESLLKRAREHAVPFALLEKRANQSMLIDAAAYLSPQIRESPFYMQSAKDTIDCWNETVTHVQELYRTADGSTLHTLSNARRALQQVRTQLHGLYGQMGAEVRKKRITT
jgi:hypothetical protein